MPGGQIFSETEQKEFAELRAEVRIVHGEFRDKANEWENILATQLPEITTALEKVLSLVELVPTLCLKDRAAYRKHLQDHSDASSDDELKQLKLASHAAYSVIDAKEKDFDVVQHRVLAAFEQAENFIGRAEKVEDRAKTMGDTAITAWHALRQERENKRYQYERAQKEAYEAAQDLENKRRKVDEKYNVNSNIVTGLVDFFSRKDDQFDLALSLGIGEKEQRDSDNRVLNSMVETACNNRRYFEEAEAEAAISKTMCNRIRKAVHKIEKSAKRTQEYKLQAMESRKALMARKAALVNIARELTEVENSMERFEVESSLPTIAEMSLKILSVVVAVAHYQQLEPAVAIVNRKIFRLIQQNNDWDAMGEDDEDVKKLYEEAVEKVAQGGY